MLRTSSGSCAVEKARLKSGVAPGEPGAAAANPGARRFNPGARRESKLIFVPEISRKGRLAAKPRRNAAVGPPARACRRRSAPPQGSGSGAAFLARGIGK